MFIGFGASAQVYQNMAQPGYKFGRARFDSVLTIPTGLGAMRNITGGQDTGQIRFNVSDSSVYVWNGRRWVRPVGGGVSDTLKVSVSDTAAMLANYAKSAAVALKVNISDTAAMLSPYVRAASLTIPTLTQVLEAAPGSNEAGANQIKDLSAGTSQNDAATFGQLTDTANLRLRISDTASMLSAYARSAAVTSSLALKLNISDTAAMLRRYLDTLQAHNTRIIAAGGGGGGSTGWALTGNASAVTDFLGTTNNRTMRFRTNNVERMVIDSIGRVGIGNNTPTSILDMIGNSTVTSKLKSTLNTGVASYAAYTHTNELMDVGVWGTIAAGFGTIEGGNAYIYGSNSLAVTAIQNIKFGSGSSLVERMRLTTSGRLLLGTITENTSALLNVTSTTQGVLIPRMTLTQRNAIASPAAGLQVIVTGETGGEFLSFYNGTTAAWQRVVKLTSAGRLLLGTTTESTHILDVVGTQRITGQILSTVSGNSALRIQSNSWFELSPNDIISASGSSLIGGGTPGMGIRYATAITFGTGGIGYHYLTNNYALFSSQSSAVNLSSGVPASAVLEARSTTQGFLPPRMTTVQKLAIGSPAAGLQVYDTTLNQMSYYNGTTWVNF